MEAVISVMHVYTNKWVVVSVHVPMFQPNIINLILIILVRHTSRYFDLHKDSVEFDLIYFYIM
jgi:hypothetical protein